MTPITEERKKQFNEILDQIALALDLSEEQVEEAVRHYKELGDFLQAPASPLREYSPEIFPQGSFRIGTAIKPIREEDEYDIDLVCELRKAPASWSQKRLKDEIGTYLKSSIQYAKHVHEERRRCWVLKFEGDTHFHLDVVPALPDPVEFREASSVQTEPQLHGLRITDNQHECYDSSDREEWPKSNPVGYSTWFLEQIKGFEEQRKMMSERLKLSVQEVPDWKVITPLQRAVQILKRHRDMMFGDDDDKPISIIITTLAGKAYGQQDNLFDTLIGLLENMPLYILSKADDKGQLKPWIPNPIDREENFADKWEEYPKRKENFYNWLRVAKNELTTAIGANGLHLILKHLEKSFGDRLVKGAYHNYGERLRHQRESGNMFMNADTGLLGDSGRTKVKNHDFFGYE